MKVNQTRLTRVYPKGLRVDSSNFAALSVMAAGVQLAAMNYQTNDKPMWLYAARFEDNGAAGYIEQPLRCFQPSFDPLFVAPSAECVLVLEIISGWQLPKVRGSHSDVIDPFVQVDTYGHSADKKKCRTFRFSFTMARHVY
jgi:hypothetical protein